MVELKHQKFDVDEPTVRPVEPYILKESKGRWYLLARDRNDHRIKTFGLDRILEFRNTPSRFDYPTHLDVNEMFRSCFGVINPDDALPEEIILLFGPDQGKYVKSYPIHESQSVLEENDRELKIRLNLFITRDLVMELLTYGSSVKVLSPASLANTISHIHREAFEQYSHGSGSKS